MITLSEATKEKLLGHLQSRPEKGLAVRLSIVGRARDSFRYDFRTVFGTDKQPGDTVIDAGGFEILIDPETAPDIAGSTLDVDANGVFKIENPNPVWRDPKGPAILDVIESQINPNIAMHGGHITLLDVKDDIVYIAFGGGCMGCGMANVTLRHGVHRMIREAVPEIRDVVDMTEHALGANPYYRPGAVGQSPAAQGGEDQ